jgi:hypothetical protein
MFGGGGHGPDSTLTKPALSEIGANLAKPLLDEFDFRRRHLFVHFLLLFTVLLWVWKAKSRIRLLMKPIA